MSIHSDLIRLGACEKARIWADDKDEAVIWATCPHTEWMFWWIGATKPDGYERDLRCIAADIAEMVLPIYEIDYPGDDRPRKAIAAARDYAHGRIDASARAAAGDAAWDAAGAAARAAAGDAHRDIIRKYYPTMPKAKGEA